MLEGSEVMAEPHPRADEIKALTAQIEAEQNPVRRFLLKLLRYRITYDVDIRAISKEK